MTHNIWCRHRRFTKTGIYSYPRIIYSHDHKYLHTPFIMWILIFFFCFKYNENKTIRDCKPSPNIDNIHTFWQFDDKKQISNWVSDFIIKNPYTTKGYWYKACDSKFNYEHLGANWKCLSCIVFSLDKSWKSKIWTWCHKHESGSRSVHRTTGERVHPILYEHIK